MSSTGWSRAAPLYKLAIPNDPRLGWAPKRLNIVQFTVYMLCIVGWFVAAYESSSPLLTVSVAIGLILFLVLIIVLWYRGVRSEVQCAPLTEEQLRYHIVEVQGAAIRGTIDSGAKSQLGEDLGADWVGIILMSALVFWLLASGQSSFSGLIWGIATVGTFVAARMVASSWIENFKKRIYERKCVGCGYLHGGPMEPLTLCPECGVMLPVMELVPPVNPISATRHT